MLFQVMPKVIASCGSSLFDNLVITTAIDLVIIKGDPVQRFQKPAVFTTELVCKRPGPQGILVATTAYLDVPIPAGKRKVGLICGIHSSIAKLLLDGVKPFGQLVSKHLFVKEIE